MAVNVLNRYTGAILATFPGASLAGVDFGGFNLTNADLSNRDLSNCVFRGCVCPGSTFQNSNLNGASFFRGNVQGSDFRGVTRNAATNMHCCFFEDVLLDVADQNLQTWAHPAGYGGQSNCLSIDSGACTPDASVPYHFDLQTDGNSGGVWLGLQVAPIGGDHGAEIVFGNTVKAAGYDVGVGKWPKGATTMSQWAGAGSANFDAIMQPQLLLATAQQQTVWPGKLSRWSFNWCLGEDDARANGSGASFYKSDLLKMLVAISGLVGNNVWRYFLCCRTASWLDNAKAASLDNVRNAETDVSAGRIQSLDGLARLGDSVHLSAAGQDQLGALWAALWLSFIPNQPP